MDVILTGSEIDTALKALEMYIALHLGRYRDISTLYRFDCESEQYEEAIAYERGRENILLLIGNRLMPDLAMFSLKSANRGIYQDLVDDRARDAYDLLQVIRYADAWYRRPEGGNEVTFMKPSFSGRYEPPYCKTVAVEGKETLNVSLCEEQMEILKEAAVVYCQLLSGQMRQVFGFFTTDTEALEMSEEIEPLFPDVIRKELVEQAEKLCSYLYELS